MIQPSKSAELLEACGFTVVGRVVGEGEEQHMAWQPNVNDAAGTAGAVYVIVNPDGRVYKVGQTSRGAQRVKSYGRVIDGRAMKKPHDQRKLLAQRQEVRGGATMWVRQIDDPKLLEDLLCVVLDPFETESSDEVRRETSKREELIRSAIANRSKDG